MFRTSVHCFQFPTCHNFASNSGSNELSRVKLQRTDLKGNKNYFELARGSSYHEFELPWVKLQWMYEGNPGEIDFGLR